MNRSPEEVLAEPCPDLPDDAVIQAIVVVYQWYSPGRDDDLERGPFLAFNRDTQAGVWNQLGMLESVTNDFRADLRRERTDE